MINTVKLNEILIKYKENLSGKWWLDERYKWEAVKHFKANWKVDEPDFAEMLKKSLGKTYNLLASMNNFPRRMIELFAEKSPEEVRAMFISLYDESRDIIERIKEFKEKSGLLLEKYGGGAKQHFQGENAISIYLWLRYPDKYCIYKFAEVSEVAKAVESDYYFKKGRYGENLRNFYSLYDEIWNVIIKDAELKEIISSLVDENCDADTQLRTLTSDVGYYISRFYNKDVPLYAKENEKENSEKLYGKSNFLNDVYITEARYNALVQVLNNKKNIILQGAPGVGKTYAAKRLAYSIMGERDEERIEFIQFHQNYSYEDFVMGYKPSEDGFELKKGIFYRFCQRASEEPGKDYFFIIDEINRGNMSKIFGELLMLIERDYRGCEITLAYDGKPFCVPKNLYIIGMMNTADRSLAMIDYALRRRFSFFDMEPGFDSEGFVAYKNKLDNETLNRLIDKVQELNCEITADKSLGKGFCIGHSYFCGQTVCTEEWLYSVVEYDIIPMLAEYWFDDKSKLQKWENSLRGVLQ